MPSCPEIPVNPPEVEALFPPDSAPEDRIEEPSALCSYGVTRQVMHGILRQILLQHFSDVDNILNYSLRERLRRNSPGERRAWSHGDGSAVEIESIFNWKPEKAEFRPLILLRPEEWRWVGLSVANRTGVDSYTGTEYFSGEWEGSHVVFCISKEAAEADLLATEVAKLFLRNSTRIMEDFGVPSFRMASLGRCVPVKEAPENYGVPVTLVYRIQESWDLQPEAPRLKTISLSREDLKIVV